MSWSQQRQGLIALSKQIRREYLRGRISREEAVEFFRLASRAPDTLLRQLARQFKSDRDYQALHKTLMDSLGGGEGDTVTTHFSATDDCSTYASGVWSGCILTGGLGVLCNDFAGQAYCGCVGGTYIGAGSDFCL